VIYLSFCTAGGAVFATCSYWMYHYVDLEVVDSQIEGISDEPLEPVHGRLAMDAGPSGLEKPIPRRVSDDIEELEGHPT